MCSRDYLRFVRHLVLVFVIVACVTSMASGASRRVREKREEPKQITGSTAVSKETRQNPFFRIPYVVDKNFNAIMMLISIYSWWYFLMPALCAFVLGFGWPFYEYMKNGYTHYSPGVIWDKDFTEYFHWYFKHKIYKKRYWNLDAFLYAYYESHNENLKTFYKTEELKLKAGSGEDGKKEAYGHGEEQNEVQPDKMEEILSSVMQDMIENNEYLRKFIQDMAGSDGYERIKSVVKEVMDEEFSPQNRLGLPIFTGYSTTQKTLAEKPEEDMPHPMGQNGGGNSESPPRFPSPSSGKLSNQEAPVYVPHGSAIAA